MKLWIIEQDHEPMRGVPFFRDDAVSTAAMKKWLDSLPTDDGHYYDAVLYERIERKPEVHNVESA